MTNVVLAESQNSTIYASATSSISSPSSPMEIKMSPEGMEILCKYYPLNSRCQLGQEINSNGDNNSTKTPSKPVENQSTPDSTSPVSPTKSPDMKNTDPGAIGPTSADSADSGNLTPRK